MLVASWAIIGLFYVLNELRVEYTLIGVFQELLMIPCLVIGAISPIVLIIRVCKKSRE